MAMCPYRMTVGDLLLVTEIKMKSWQPSAKPGQRQSLWNYQGLLLHCWAVCLSGCIPQLFRFCLNTRLLHPLRSTDQLRNYKTSTRPTFNPAAGREFLHGLAIC